jgi:hypothetical protein
MEFTLTAVSDLDTDDDSSQGTPAEDLSCLGDSLNNLDPRWQRCPRSRQGQKLPLRK